MSRRLTATQVQQLQRAVHAAATAPTAEEEHDVLRSIVSTCQSVLLADRDWGAPVAVDAS